MSVPPGPYSLTRLVGKHGLLRIASYVDAFLDILAALSHQGHGDREIAILTADKVIDELVVNLLD